MRATRLAVPLLLSLSFQVAAQQPPASETIEVRLLEVDVVVTDRDGKPVHGLTAADFELIESGEPQPITNLSEYSVAPEAPGTAPTAAGRPEPRTLILLLDPLPLRGTPRNQLFENLRSLATRLLREGDRAQIYAWTGSRFYPLLEPTSDRAKVLATLTQFEQLRKATETGKSIERIEAYLRESASARHVPFDPSQLEAERRFIAEEDLAVMRRKTASMQRMVSSLTTRNSRPIVVYVSDQFSRIAGKRAFIGARADYGLPSPDEEAYDTTDMIAAIVKSANANGIAFYALRPRLPITVADFDNTGEMESFIPKQGSGTDAAAVQLLILNETEALGQLAEQTGGKLTMGPKGVEDGVEQIVADLTNYYSLGWRARSDGMDRERRIRVRAKNPDYRVRTRDALVEKSDETRAKDLLVARLFEEEGENDLDFELSVGEAKPVGRGRWKFLVVLTFDPEQFQFRDEGVGHERRRVGRFSILSVAGGDISETTGISRDSRQFVGGSLPRFTFEVLADNAQRSLAIGLYDEIGGAVGVRRLDLAARKASVREVTFRAPTSPAWQEARERAAREGKPLLVFFRPKLCPACDEFERDSISHPAIVRRLPQLVFAPVPYAAPWNVKQPGLALIDESGGLRATWPGIPSTSQFLSIADSVITATPNFQRAAALESASDPYAGKTNLAIGTALLGRIDLARAILSEVMLRGTHRQQQLAIISSAYLDAGEGLASEAITALNQIIADPATANDVRADAWLAYATIQQNRGANEEAAKGYRAAIETGSAGSTAGIEAAKQLAQIPAEARSAGSKRGPFRLVPFDEQIVTGQRGVRTSVTSTNVARVAFSLDGGATAVVSNPPFTTKLDFGDMPESHVVRAIAYDEKGMELGRDEMTVNDGGDVFWMRLAEPSGAHAKGSVPVSVLLRIPPARAVRAVTISWNDEPIASLSEAPWRTVATIPGQVGILRAVAELDDGRIVEDAVLLNAPGYVERTEVQVVEIPVTVTPTIAVEPKELSVREGRKVREVQSVTMGAEAPLTVGLLFDTSQSMEQRLSDLQEAALLFIETGLDPADRVFLISFDTRATLVQPPTTDRDALRDAILDFRPSGLTSLHDAMILGLLQFEGVRGRRGLVVFTDGLDRTSRYKPADLAAMAKRSNVPIYLITTPMNRPGFDWGSTMWSEKRGGKNDPGPVLTGNTGAEDLERMARRSGGRLHEMTSLGQLPRIYASIADALRAQVIVAIRTEPARKENDWREIDVDVKKRGIDVRAPAGYYAR